MYIPVDYSHRTDMPLFSQLLLNSFDDLSFPHFFIIEGNKFHIDLDNVHPVCAADYLVNIGLLINTHISYN